MDKNKSLHNKIYHKNTKTKLNSGRKSPNFRPKFLLRLEQLVEIGNALKYNWTADQCQVT